MSEPSEPTIRISAIRPADPPETSSARPKRQHWGYALMLVTMTVGIFGGFGAWHFLGGRISSDGLESLDEIDGFELATPFVAVQSNEESANSERESADVLSVPNVGDDAVASSQTVKSDDAPSPKVWLTGTIEEETTERIELPSRISGGPSDSNAFR